MFGWLYKRVACGVIAAVDLEKLLNDEANQKLIYEFFDDLYARYTQKVLNTAMKAQQVVGGGSMPSILNRKGEINLKGLVPLFINNFLGGQSQGNVDSQNQSQGAKLKFGQG